jgi:hypothetical protein
MSNCFSKPKKQQVYGIPIPSSLQTVIKSSTYVPQYCVSGPYPYYSINGPADRNPIGKGEAIKYNSYDRYLNRIRKMNCNLY